MFSPCRSTAWQQRTSPCWRPNTWWRRAEANWPWRCSGMTAGSWSASQRWRTAPRTATTTVAKTAARRWTVRELNRCWRGKVGNQNREDKGPEGSINSGLSNLKSGFINFISSVSHQTFRTLMRGSHRTEHHVQLPKRGGHAGTDRLCSATPSS